MSNMCLFCFWSPRAVTWRELTFSLACMGRKKNLTRNSVRNRPHSTATGCNHGARTRPRGGRGLGTDRHTGSHTISVPIIGKISKIRCRRCCLSEPWLPLPVGRLKRTEHEPQTFWTFGVMGLDENEKKNPNQTSSVLF